MLLLATKYAKEQHYYGLYQKLDSNPWLQTTQTWTVLRKLSFQMQWSGETLRAILNKLLFMNYSTSNGA